MQAAERVSNAPHSTPIKDCNTPQALNSAEELVSTESALVLVEPFTALSDPAATASQVTAAPSTFAALFSHLKRHPKTIDVDREDLEKVCKLLIEKKCGLLPLSGCIFGCWFLNVPINCVSIILRLCKFAG